MTLTPGPHGPRRFRRAYGKTGRRGLSPPSPPCCQGFPLREDWRMLERFSRSGRGLRHPPRPSGSGARKPFYGPRAERISFERRYASKIHSAGKHRFRRNPRRVAARRTCVRRSGRSHWNALTLNPHSVSRDAGNSGQNPGYSQRLALHPSGRRRNPHHRHRISGAWVLHRPSPRRAAGVRPFVHPAASSASMCGFSGECPSCSCCSSSISGCSRSSA